MKSRSSRLQRLLRVQNQLTAYHEMRRAGMLKAAHAAESEAGEIAARKDGAGSLSDLFPGLYERGMARAFATRDQNLEAARLEAEKLATESVRTHRIEEDYRTAFRKEEREAEERDGLEAVERMIGKTAG